MAEPLPIEVETLDAVPEPLRPFYEEREGKFVLPVQVDDPTPLKEALRKDREAHREARRKLDALERKGTALYRTQRSLCGARKGVGRA